MAPHCGLPMDDPAAAFQEILDADSSSSMAAHATRDVSAFCRIARRVVAGVRRGHRQGGDAVRRGITTTLTPHRNDVKRSTCHRKST